jgi:hypothetical protein
VSAVLDLLDQLADQGVTVRLESDRRLRLLGPRRAVSAPEVAAVIAANRELIRCQMMGESTGHTLSPCSECGVEIMVPYRRSTWPKCVMTPRCPGLHTPRARDVQRLAAARAPAPPKIPNPPRSVSRKRLLGPRPAFPNPGP